MHTATYLFHVYTDNITLHCHGNWLITASMHHDRTYSMFSIKASKLDGESDKSSIIRTEIIIISYKTQYHIMVVSRLHAHAHTHTHTHTHTHLLMSALPICRCYSSARMPQCPVSSHRTWSGMLWLWPPPPHMTPLEGKEKGQAPSMSAAATHQ